MAAIGLAAVVGASPRPRLRRLRRSNVGLGGGLRIVGQDIARRKPRSASSASRLGGRCGRDRQLRTRGRWWRRRSEAEAARAGGGRLRSSGRGSARVGIAKRSAIAGLGAASARCASRTWRGRPRRWWPVDALAEAEPCCGGWPAGGALRRRAAPRRRLMKAGRAISRAWRADLGLDLADRLFEREPLRVISDSSSGGVTPRNCATSAVRARS